MSKNKILIIISLILMLCTGYVIGSSGANQLSNNGRENLSKTWIATTSYLCDKDHEIIAVYYEYVEPTTSIPTGSVELTINGVPLKALKKM